jgi:hypothetical protein
MPDDDLETRNTAAVVLTAYTTAVALAGDRRYAFDAAVRAWRERNPSAPPEDGPRAVASIICNKL